VAAKHSALDFDAALPPVSSYMLNGIDYQQLRRIKASSLSEIARWAGQGRAGAGQHSYPHSTAQQSFM
jgi:hypothetical protein